MFLPSEPLCWHLPRLQQSVAAAVPQGSPPSPCSRTPPAFRVWREAAHALLGQPWQRATARARLLSPRSDTKNDIHPVEHTASFLLQPTPEK